MSDYRWYKTGELKFIKENPNLSVKLMAKILDRSPNALRLYFYRNGIRLKDLRKSNK